MGAEADWSHLLRPASKTLLQELLAGRKSLTELAAAAGVAKPSLLPTLKRLAEAGWIEREEVRLPSGREVFYSLKGGSLHLELRPDVGVAIGWASEGRVDDQFPLTSQIADAAIREEVLTILRLLRSKLKRLFEKDAFSIVLFGSAARGQMTWKSDIDLLFVVHHEDPMSVHDAIHNAIAELQEFVTHAARAHVVGVDDFVTGKGTIAKEAAKDGIVLVARREARLWAKMERHRTISI